MFLSDLAKNEHVTVEGKSRIFCRIVSQRSDQTKRLPD